MRLGSKACVVPMHGEIKSALSLASSGKPSLPQKTLLPLRESNAQQSS
jgi:hypothetical protein